MPDHDGVSIRKLILVPAVVTLAVTLLRLTGELLHWSPALFSAEPGGGGALVGISWLPLLFGPYFGVKLAGAGAGPERPLRSGVLLFLALALLPLAGFAATAAGLPQEDLRMLLVFVVAAVVALPIAVIGWPALGRTLLAYAFAARLPVVIVMLVAMLGGWGTHYDLPPPGFPPMGPWARWLWIGLLPQLTIWIAYTVIVGGLLGLAAGAVVARRPRAASA